MPPTRSSASGCRLSRLSHGSGVCPRGIGQVTVVDSSRHGEDVISRQASWWRRGYAELPSAPPGAAWLLADTADSITAPCDIANRTLNHHFATSSGTCRSIASHHAFKVRRPPYASSGITKYYCTSSWSTPPHWPHMGRTRRSRHYAGPSTSDSQAVALRSRSTPEPSERIIPVT